MKDEDFLTGSPEDWVRAATQAKSAFDQLRHEMQQAAKVQLIPSPGTLVGGRYRVERELGQGGFGNVYLVKHDMLGRRFAMKVLNARIANDPDWVARFREEARATSLIGQENIVYVTDFGQDESYGYFFVMEYLEGRPLDGILLDQGPQQPERILRFVHAAASALGAVHELGIVHCDLKPSNVFSVARPGREELWKLLDFGTSTIVMSAVETEALYGTPRYMAPEQSIGGEVDGRADQFSLGCIVYEMLTGVPPWDVRNWLQAMPENRMRRPPKPPSELRKGCPRGWDAIILRAISVPREKRFESIDEFARALEASASVRWTPSVDPLDVRQRNNAAEFERTHTAPSVEIVTSLEQSSMVIDFDAGKDITDLPLVSVTFLSRERLIREYRRNLGVGGIFIPSDDLLPLRAMVFLELELESTADRCRVRASVVGHETRREVGRGFGLAVDAEHRGRLDEFLARIRGPSLSPGDVLDVGRAVRNSDRLSPAEGFVLSRLEGGIAFSRLRGMCAGLPFDIEQLATELVARGLAVVRSSEQPPVSRPRRQTIETPVPSETRRPSMSSREVEMVIERVDFHRHQGNYLAATDVLRKAIAVAPDEALFHYRLALLRNEFGQDIGAAVSTARRAVELQPGNQEYRALLEVLRKRRETS